MTDRHLPRFLSTLVLALPMLAMTHNAEAAAASTRASEFTLSNGMNVVVIPDHRAPVVTHMVWYRIGGADEVRGTSGIAHFLEHLMFKSTEKIAVGEFSKIAQVSGRQLRFYEQIGLLKPEHSDPQSGYRFYTAAQLPRLNRILALKELGFTLEEISPMLDSEISQDELRGMLTLKRAQVAHTVQEETARLKLIESRIEQIDRGNDPAAVDMVIKSVPMQSYLSVRTVSADMAAGYALFQRVMTEVPRTTLRIASQRIRLSSIARSWPASARVRCHG